MCGICGYSGKDNYDEDKIKTLLLFNQDRGEDSLGYYVPKNEIFKKVGKPVDILCDSKYNSIPEGNFFIGHTRAATSGLVNEKNAHPFKSNNIILAMNGTLSNDTKLAKEAGIDIMKYDVDSEILTVLLDKAQSKEPLTKILGGCALIYTDTNTGIMYCYRNSDRPLYRGKINDNMYISSIKESLEFIKCEDIKEFKQDVLYSITNGKIIHNIPVKRAIEEDKPIIIDSKFKYGTRVFKDGIEFVKVNFLVSDISIFTGLYLQTVEKFNIYHSGKNITPKKVYKILGASKTSSYLFRIKGDDGKEIEVSKYIFEDCIPVIKEGSYVYTKVNLMYDKTKELYCKNTDLLYIESLDPVKDKIDTRNTTNNKSGVLTITSVRPAYPEEIKEDLYDEESPFDLVLPENLSNFKDQLDLVDFSSMEDVSDFIIDGIESELVDIDEVNKDQKIDFCLNKIKVLLDFYESKKGVLNA